MDLTIKAQVKGGWRVVLLPTLVFLAAWAVPPLGVFLVSHSEQGSAYVVAGALGVPLAVFVTAILHRAVFKPRSDSEQILVLGGDRLQWRRHAICLNVPYHATIRVEPDSGSAQLSMEIRGPKRALHLFAEAVPCPQIGETFPDPGFLLPNALGPDQGAPAWVIGADDAIQVLSALWRQRRQNTMFQFYGRFPWEERSARGSGVDGYLPFASPAAQTEIARALAILRPKEVWLTAEALLFREGDQVRRMPLGTRRLEAVPFGESALQWFLFGDKSFWVEDLTAAEVDFLLRYVNRR